MLDTKYLLTDEQMIHFITKGYLVLTNDLPEQTHRRVMDKIYYVLHEEGNPGNNILPRVPEIQQFFDTPTVKGALTSVLGPDYYMHPHRHCHYNRPGSQTPGGGQWHKDGYWSSMRPSAVVGDDILLYSGHYGGDGTDGYHAGDAILREVSGGQGRNVATDRQGGDDGLGAF